MEDLKWLGKINKRARSVYRDDSMMDISDCGEKVRQLIEEHVYATTPHVLVEPIDILSNKFEQKLDEIKSPEARAAEMEHAIKHEIRIKLDENPVLYTSLKERLEELIEQRKSRQLSIEDMPEAMYEIRGVMQNQTKESAESGMDPKQYPFYQMFVNELDTIEDDLLKDLTHIVTGRIKEPAVIDWTVKDDVKRQMRRQIKKKLREYQCPGKKVDALALQLVALAETHYKHIAY